MNIETITILITLIIGFLGTTLTIVFTVIHGQNNLRHELKQDNASLRDQLKEQINSLEERLERRIDGFEHELRNVRQELTQRIDGLYHWVIGARRYSGSEQYEDQREYRKEA